MRWGLVLLTVIGCVFAGCVDEPAPLPAEDAGVNVGETLDPDDPLSEYTWNGTSLLYDELHPPVLRTGTAWTYEAGGVWALTGKMTIIVTEGDDDGYAFGAASTGQLLNTAVWWQYWYGPMDTELNQKEIDTKLLDWPLFDGKVFPLHDLAMTVVADLIDTPLGTLPGYRIAGNNDKVAVAYTYVPEIGYLTSYSYGPADGSAIWESLDLVEVGTAETAYWLERGDRFSITADRNAVGNGPDVNVTTYEVAPGYDEMIFVGLGTEGAGAGARSVDPMGPTWGYEDADGLWDWKVGRLTATPGTWVFEAHQRLDGWAYFEGLPVKWMTLDASA